MSAVTVGASPPAAQAPSVTGCAGATSPVNGGGRGGGIVLPLAVYLHWPYCARICPYCDFAVVRDRGRRGEQAALVEAIAADLTAQAALTGPRRLTSAFFGGGTPSLMEPDDVGRLLALARSLWPPGDDLEVSLEANPTDAEAGRFSGFRDAGVGRLSLGLQAMDDASLTFLGRNHGAEEAIRAAALAAQTFPRLSLDLIYARPGQTARAWAEELRAAAGLGAEHLSPYQLTIEEGTPFDRAVRRGRFAAADEALGAALYETTQETLEGLGFHAYEVSNHALGRRARSRHNEAYWLGWDYVGVGPGAHGRLTLEGARHATEAPGSVARYVAQVRETGTGWIASERQTPAEAAEERLLMGLRLDRGVPLADLAPLVLRTADGEAAGLVVLEDGRLRATPAGRLVLDRLTLELIG